MSGYNRKPKRFSPRNGDGSQPGRRNPSDSGSSIPGTRTGNPKSSLNPDLPFDGISWNGNDPTRPDLSGLISSQANIDSSFSSLLQLFANNNTDNSFAQTLNGLGIQQNQGLTGAQRDDWNNFLLQTLISYLSEKESRQYNEGRLSEQRNYDNPQNQLARMMGAGISRDAAIQLLNGSGSGASSSLLTGNAAAIPQGVSPSQSRLNEVQSNTAIANSVFAGISSVASAIGGLGSFGMSAAAFATNLAATKAATAGQVLSNTQLSKTLNGIESASTIIGAISSASQAGIVPEDHEFTSAQDMIKFVNDHADEFEPFNALKSSGALDGITQDVYSLDALNHGYSSWRKTRDQHIDRKHITTMYALDELFKNLDIDRINSEISVNYQNINKSIADVINSTKLTNAEVINSTKLTDAEVSLKYAQVDLTNYQADIAYQQKELGQIDLDWMYANADDINSIRTNQVSLDAARWSELSGDPQALRAEIDSWLSHRENLRTAIALESIYYSRKKSAAEVIDGNGPMTGFEKTAQMVVYWHNMLDQNLSTSSPTDSEINTLGDLSASKVALWALRKYYHMP